MDPGLLSFHSIIHDEMMPWLPGNSDPEKFRMIMRRVGQVPDNNKEQYFSRLGAAMNDMGVVLKKEVSVEWSCFSKISFMPEFKDAFSIVFTHSPGPRANFYFILMAFLTPAFLTALYKDYSKSRNIQYREYIIMKAMGSISALLKECRPPDESDQESRIIIERVRLVLGFIYLETAYREKGMIAWHKLPLRIAEVKEMIRETGKNNESNQALAEAILARFAAGRNCIEEAGDKTKAPDRGKEKDDKPGEVTGSAGGSEPESRRESGPLTNGEKEEDVPLGVYDACKLLGVSRNTLNEMRRRGEIGSRQIGHRYKYSRNEILKLVK